MPKVIDFSVTAIRHAGKTIDVTVIAGVTYLEISLNKLSFTQWVDDYEHFKKLPKNMQYSEMRTFLTKDDASIHETQAAIEQQRIYDVLAFFGCRLTSLQKKHLNERLAEYAHQKILAVTYSNVGMSIPAALRDANVLTVS
jgi:tRNA A22 N-methylase